VITRTAFLFAGVLTVSGAACAGDEAGRVTSTIVAAPAPKFGITVAPSPLALTLLPHTGVTLCLSYSTTFDLIVQNRGPSDLLLSEATFRMIDGTALGGPMVPIPSGELTRRFGRPLIRRGTTRGFRFDERFGCGVRTPRSLGIDARFEEVGGGSSVATIEVPAS
jgi:hypothetical protein